MKLSIPKQLSGLISKLYFVGVNFKSSPIEVREKFAFLPSELQNALKAFSNAIGPTVILSTCNRTEIYCSSELSVNEVRQKSLKLISTLKSLDENLVAEHTILHNAEDAARHLFRVSAGLESMILGEGQILNQLKNAYLNSHDYTDNLLNQLFQRALSTGKRVRTSTQIARGAMSVPAAALQIIQKLIYPEELAQKKIMVLGSGEVAQLSLELLHSQGASGTVTVVNRSQNHALQLTELGVTHTINYHQLHEHLQTQDIILACTSAPHYIIQPEFFDDPQHKAIIFDMSLPRNVDPELVKMPNIKLIDLDHLKQTVQNNCSERAKQINHAEAILQEELQKLSEWAEKRVLYAEEFCSS